MLQAIFLKEEQPYSNYSLIYMCSFQLSYLDTCILHLQMCRCLQSEYSSWKRSTKSMFRQCSLEKKDASIIISGFLLICTATKTNYYINPCPVPLFIYGKASNCGQTEMENSNSFFCYTPVDNSRADQLTLSSNKLLWGLIPSYAMIWMHFLYVILSAVWNQTE